MVNEAQKHESEDKKAMETVESRNKLDNMIMSIEKTIRENKEKIEAGDLQATETALEKARGVLKESAQDKAALDTAYDELMRASHSMAEKLYKSSSAKATADTASDKPADDPIDAEINS
jgi:molecular chaperone DnaK